MAEEPSPRTRKSTGRRTLALAAALVTTAALLAACGGSSKPVLTWYINPDPLADENGNPIGQTKLAMQCSTDKYDVNAELLPQDATQQRVQLERRLAASDSSIDLMSLDPVFTGEFAAADFLEPISDANAEEFSKDVLQGAMEGASWEGKLAVVPLWANTQVLWYRKAVAEKAGLNMDQPVTWDQVINAASKEDKTVQVQANKYEGYVVWINALIQGAGGAIITNTEAGPDAKIEIDSEAGKEAAAVIQKLADSPAASADLSVSNEGTDEAGFFADASGGFMTNWTFIYNDAKNSGQKGLLGDLGWSRYPQTVEGTDSKPPSGGINIGIGAFSKYPDLAAEAAACITKVDSQVQYALETGNMPATASAYQDPKLEKAFPKELLQLFRDSIDTAGPRPPSAYWSYIVSAVLSRWHPPSGVSPESTPSSSSEFIDQVLNGEALL